MAGIDPGDEVIVPAPYWVSYPDMVVLAEGTPVIVSDQRGRRFQAPAGGAGSRDHAEHPLAHVQLAVQPHGRGVHAGRDGGHRRRARRSPHVGVLADDIYEHLVYDDFRLSHHGRGRAPAVRAHHHHQRGLQGLRDDRLAHRLRRRPARDDRGHGQDPVAVDLQPVLHQPARGHRRTGRAAGLDPRTPRRLSGAPRPRGRHAERGGTASSARCRRARSTSIRAAPG